MVQAGSCRSLALTSSSSFRWLKCACLAPLPLQFGPEHRAALSLGRTETTERAAPFEEQPRATLPLSRQI